MRKDEGPGSSLATAPGLDSPVLAGTLVPVPPAPEVHGLETLHRKGIHAAATSSGSHDLLRVWLRSIAAGVGGEPLSNREEFARELDRGRRRILDLEARHDHLTSQLAGLEAATLPDGTGPAAPRSLEPLKHELAELRIRRETILAASGSSRSRFRFVMESVVLALLTAYLYFFYVNAGHSAFSKNLGEAAAVAAGSGDISLLFHSLFDPGAFLAAVSGGNVLLLLFPFVFVAFAIGFHGALSSPRGGRWKAAGLFLATLAIDVLVAYLITRNSHDIRVLTGLATGSFGPREAALEPRFWIVIFLGIVVAVLWGLLYGSWVSHLSDNGEKEVEARIRGKEAEIADRISEHSRQKSDVERSIGSCREELAAAARAVTEIEERGQQILPPWDEIERRCLAFLNGWLSAIAALSALPSPCSPQNDRSSVEDARRVGLETLDTIRTARPAWVN